MGTTTIPSTHPRLNLRHADGGPGIPTGPLLLVAGVVVAIGVSAFAFRGRR